MNIIKLTEGIKDTGDGIQDVAIIARPIVTQLQEQKKVLDEENATTVKKVGFMVGFTLLHILERWNDIKKPVFEIKDGVTEIIQAVKEPGLTDEGFKDEKAKIEAKQQSKCDILAKRKANQPALIKESTANPLPKVADTSQNAANLALENAVNNLTTATQDVVNVTDNNSPN